jgi:GRAB domain
MEALRRLRRGAANTNVDRRLVTNILLTFLNTPREDTKRFEILGLLASILFWSDDERTRAGLQRTGANSASAAHSPARPRPLELEKTDETEVRDKPLAPLTTLKGHPVFLPSLGGISSHRSSVWRPLDTTCHTYTPARWISTFPTSTRDRALATSNTEGQRAHFGPNIKSGGMFLICFLPSLRILLLFLFCTFLLWSTFINTMESRTSLPASI